jgi:hypothetical protein
MKESVAKKKPGLDTRSEEIFGNILNKYRQKAYSVEKLINPKSLFPMSALLIDDAKLLGQCKFKMEKENLIKDLGIVLKLQNCLMDKTDAGTRKKILEKRVSLNIEKTFNPLYKKNAEDLIVAIGKNRQENKTLRDTLTHMKEEAKANNNNNNNYTISHGPKKYHIDLSNINTLDSGAPLNTTQTLSFNIATSNTNETEDTTTTRKPKISFMGKTAKHTVNFRNYKNCLKSALLKANDDSGCIVSYSNIPSNQSLFNLKTTNVPIKLSAKNVLEAITRDSLDTLYNRISSKNYKTKIDAKEAIQSYFQKTVANFVVDDRYKFINIVRSSLSLRT